MNGGNKWQPSIGALLQEGGVQFRVWAPARRQVDVVIYQNGQASRVAPLDGEDGGYWSAFVPGLGAGAQYKFRLEGHLERPDPASRFQPQGVHGVSQVVDPAFPWRDHGWQGVAANDLILYEVHTGTATPAGTFEALIERLPHLVSLGVTALELMPVADFPGERNWGYDGVCYYAPSRAYGGGMGLKRLVDAAHAQGLGVLLDVVYNHLGPSGNYLRDYTKSYFSSKHHTPWGDALNFAEPAVRTFFIENALYWAHEHHIDGLRLDAVQEIYDPSAEHVLAELARRAHASLPASRRFLLYAEDVRRLASLARPPAQGGYGLDGLWADDFHHVARVTLTGERESYLAAYRGGAQELAVVLRDGWLYQGQIDPLTGEPKGTPPGDLPPHACVYSIQNHDQVGNRPFGERLHHDISPAAYRAASTLLLFAPGAPMLFMGQEWAASTPFQFFTDHEPRLGKSITEGRRKEHGGFAAFHGQEIPDPQAETTFLRSKLSWDELDQPEHAAMLDFYRRLIALRKRLPLYRKLERSGVHVEVVGEKALALLLDAEGEAPLLLIANLGGSVEVDLDLFGVPWDEWECLLDSEAGELQMGRVVRLEGARGVVLQLRRQAA